MEKLICPHCLKELPYSAAGRRPAPRTVEIVKALKHGDSQSDVARRFDLTRQRIHQIACYYQIERRHSIFGDMESTDKE